MADLTDADNTLAQAATQRSGRTVTARTVRFLRERGVLSSGGPGGRGKVTAYTDDDLAVVCAIENAKTDPAYRRKLHRAVLIAYARGAPVADPGLRRAYDEFFNAERITLARRRRGGGRKPADGELPSPVLETLVYGEASNPNAAADAMLDSARTALDLAREGLPAVVAIAHELQPGAAVEPPAALADPYGGLAKHNPHDPNAKPQPLPPVFKLVEHFNLTEFAKLADSAPRDELDMMRDMLTLMRTALKFGDDLAVAVMAAAWLANPAIRDAMNQSSA